MTKTLHSAAVRPVVRTVSRAAGASAALGVVAAATLLAGPATADVPEGWSDPDDVKALDALVLLAGVPILLFALIALAVYLPSLARSGVAAVSGDAAESEWFGGPRKSGDELAAPDTDESKAGGASGQW